ncbi:hypothetical protein H7B90_00790 [Cohnella xylanilytica]|uniref:Uncharacterized protein n=1 Tax=Cohnella xylanilytica TaxID=557555 RepID=A0A841TS37_9BACL|nr:hypothetical protein [Cohnella xylanilytica]MBB6689928.1 hypothetical protein [Cohnella xylanilytica]
MNEAERKLLQSYTDQVAWLEVQLRAARADNDRIRELASLERLTARDQKENIVYFRDGDVLVRGVAGRMVQKSEMTARHIHEKFLILDKVLERLALYEDVVYAGLRGEEPDESNIRSSC